MNQYQPLENYILQAQQKSLLPTGSLETRQLGMVLNEQVTGSSNDGKLFSASEVVPNEGSGLQEGYPLSASGDGDVLTKVSLIYMVILHLLQSDQVFARVESYILIGN